VMTPETPDVLDETATEIWQKVTKRLEDTGLISILDEFMLTRYCDLYSQYLKASQFIRKRKALTYPVRDDEGQVIRMKEYPEVKIMSALSKDLLAIEREFGMSPSARSRVEVAEAVRRQAQAEVRSGPDKSRFFNKRLG